jgi:NAD(P)-dependent dehydrogenase (short-subunit alcohol dehydrogenase family)
MLGSVDHLLCFAGVVGCQHAIDMTAAEWRSTLDINTTGSFLCAQACAKNMIQQGHGGSIIFVASISGHRVNFPRNRAISLPPVPSSRFPGQGLEAYSWPFFTQRDVLLIH